MSKTTKRKHVTREALDDYYVPEGDEEIVKVRRPLSDEARFQILWCAHIKALYELFAS